MSLEMDCMELAMIHCDRWDSGVQIITRPFGQGL